MSALLEFLFCPVHGIFRAENMAMIWTACQSCRFHLGYAIRRLGL